MNIEISDKYLLTFCGAKPEAKVTREEVSAVIKNYLYGDPSRFGDRRQALAYLVLDALERAIER